MLQREIEIVTPPPGQPPVLRAHMPAEPTIEMLSSMFLRIQKEAEARQGAMAVLIDGRAIKPRSITALHRKRAADYLRAMAEAFGDHFSGQVIVFSNPLQRGIFTAVSWLASPPWPLKVVGTLEQAEAVVTEMLSQSRAA